MLPHRHTTASVRLTELHDTLAKVRRFSAGERPKKAAVGLSPQAADQPSLFDYVRFGWLET